MTTHTATTDTDTAALVGRTILVGGKPHTVLAAWHGLGDPAEGQWAPMADSAS